MKSILITLSALLALSILFGFRTQDLSKETTGKTKLEALVGIRGVVLVRGSSEVGTFMSKYEGRVTVEAKEFTTASTGKK